jgi:hypothetical protein
LAGNIVVVVVVADTGSEVDRSAAVALVAHIVVARAVAEIEDYNLYHL